VGIGNPLLDISVDATGTDLLTKYGLEADNAIMAEEKHMPLYKELIEKHKVSYVAGGSALNTMRAGQWLYGAPGAFGYLGSVADDAYAATLRKAVADDGVLANFYLCTEADTPTGTCACLITNGKRSLVANLSAANKFDAAHVAADAAQRMLGAARILYSSSFFLTVSPPAAEALGKHALEHNKVFAMNLSAPFLMQVPPFLEAVKSLLPYADIVICNDDEARTLAKAMEWEPVDDLAATAEKLAKTTKHNEKRARTVVFTQGAKPAVVYRDGKCTEYEPVALDDEHPLVDENGAGDAYVGGLLAALARNKSFDEAMATAAYAAWVVIQRHGCALPADKPKLDFKGFSFPPAY